MGKMASSFSKQASKMSRVLSWIRIRLKTLFYEQEIIFIFYFFQNYFFTLDKAAIKICFGEAKMLNLHLCVVRVCVCKCACEGVCACVSARLQKPAVRLFSEADFKWKRKALQLD